LNFEYFFSLQIILNLIFFPRLGFHIDYISYSDSINIPKSNARPTLVYTPNAPGSQSSEGQYQQRNLGGGQF
jgi:hypothetical protein